MKWWKYTVGAIAIIALSIGAISEYHEEVELEGLHSRYLETNAEVINESVTLTYTKKKKDGQEVKCYKQSRRDIEFTYEVDGVKYPGKCTIHTHDSPVDAPHFKKTETIVIYYDPKNPSQWILKRVSADSSHLSSRILLYITIASLMPLHLYWKRLKTRNEHSDVLS